MSTLKINGELYKQLVISGAANLRANYKIVDALNVFPVPDGDTGTNMRMTIEAGATAIKDVTEESVYDMAKKVSRGMLMGARGNSGVILSQLFRGIYKGLKDIKEATVKEFAKAFLSGVNQAYHAVLKPVEGTILTVAREASERSYKALKKGDSLERYFEIYIKEAKASLDRTPELLPVLKEANVVDSGGAGLVKVLEGFLAFLQGNPITEDTKVEKVEVEKNEKASGYRVEFLLSFSSKHAKSFNEDRFRKSLESLGNEISLIVKEDGLALSLHTMTPGEVLMLAERYGQFTKVQIENIQDELNPSLLEVKEEPDEAKEYGFVAVAAGDGLKKLFTEYRVDYVVSGGQTMNPSTNDIVNAVAKVNASTVFVLPNNSNIIMAAKQASDIISDKNVIVLETKSVPQGLSACINFNPDETLDVNLEAMNDAIANVKTGSVTYAIKDTSIDGIDIEAGDYMGIFDKEIVVTSKDKLECTKSLLDKMMDDDSEIVTLLQGLDATDEETNSIEEYIDEKYDVDVDVQSGDQPVYSFIIGVE